MPVLQLKRFALGASIGLVLAGLSYIAAAAGYGTPVVISLVAAPISFFGLLPGVIAAPVMWGMFFVSAAAASPNSRRRFVRGMALHYVTGVLLVVLVLALSSEPLREVPRNRWLVPLSLAAYISAHVLLWKRFSMNRAQD